MSSIPTINDDLAKLGLSRDLSGTTAGGTATSDRSKVGRGAAGLGAEDFLALMVAQFRNQDPTKPVDNAQFIAQLASFGTVTGIDEMNKSMAALSSAYSTGQTLSAANLLGRTVLVDQGTGHLDAGGVLGAAVEVPDGSQRVAVQVKDAAGQVVRTLDLGTPPAGLAKFGWDGRRADGSAAPAGQYTLEARALVNGHTESIATSVEAVVESVTLGGGAGKPVTLSLRGLNDVKMDSIKQIS
jgi:flagellar basal-body rod modification protein FlgD